MTVLTGCLHTSCSLIRPGWLSRQYRPLSYPRDRFHSVSTFVQGRQTPRQAGYKGPSSVTTNSSAPPISPHLGRFSHLRYLSMAATPDMQKATLPTLDRLGVKLADDAQIDAPKIAREWFSSFSQAIQSGSVSDVLSLLLDNGADTWWRDLVSLSNDFRTFYGESLPRFLSDRVVGSNAQLSDFKLDESSVVIERPYPDIVWIQAMFTFRSPTRSSSGIFRLVPTSSVTGSWLAHSLFTNIEGLIDFPEQISNLREQAPNHGKWHEKRHREIECLDEDPKVIVVGGGQAGLEIAARLKYLGVKTLVIEKEPRVGNLWRKRYEALCLHDTVCEWRTFLVWRGS